MFNLPDFQPYSPPGLLANINPSRHKNQQPQFEMMLPLHLDQHLDQPFSKSASLDVDRWLELFGSRGGGILRSFKGFTPEMGGQIQAPATTFQYGEILRLSVRLTRTS